MHNTIKRVNDKWTHWARTKESPTQALPLTNRSQGASNFRQTRTANSPALKLSPTSGTHHASRSSIPQNLNTLSSSPVSQRGKIPNLLPSLATRRHRTNHAPPPLLPPRTAATAPTTRRHLSTHHVPPPLNQTTLRRHCIPPRAAATTPITLRRH